MSERKTRQLTELDLMDDFLFGTMISYPEIGERFSKHLLEIILGRELHKITIAGQKAIYGKDTRLHGIRLDVEIREDAEGGIGTIYDIEPDKKKAEKRELPRRTRYYHSLIDSRALRTGVTYNELANVYVILITDFDPFDRDRMVYTLKMCCEEEPELPYEDGSRTIFLYTKGTKGNPPRELQELLAYMEKTSRENAVNTVLQEIDEMVSSVKKDSEVTTGYMLWEVREQERINGAYREGKAEGMAEGKAEGMAEGKAEGKLTTIIELVCRKLRKSKSPAEIADELEEDIALVEKICDAAKAFAPEYDEEKVYEAFNS